ncbi:hypothetical protein EJD04_23295 [Salmonella enterica]|nr:hypothetical protein [Salmonella enterica]
MKNLTIPLYFTLAVFSSYTCAVTPDNRADVIRKNVQTVAPLRPSVDIKSKPYSLELGNNNTVVIPAGRILTMLLKDKSVAMFRLGLNARVADIIGGMTEKELHKLSTHPHFILTLRIQDSAALECLLANSRVDHLTPMPAAMLCLSDTGGRHGI